MLKCLRNKAADKGRYHFEPGTVVILQDLTRDSELNDQLGIVDCFDKRADRYEVRLVDSDVVRRIRHRNLRVVNANKAFFLDRSKQQMQCDTQIEAKTWREDAACLHGLSSEIKRTGSEHFASYDAGKWCESANKLKILIGSWNVGNAEPNQEELRQYWINPTSDVDMIVVGAQECAYKTTTGEKQDPHFDNLVKRCCGEDFYQVSAHHLWEMRIYVYAHVKHKDNIIRVVNKREATGFAHVLGNKGGLITKLDFEDTKHGRAASLCFISCHLAAHQGHVRDRNGNLEEIFRNARIENSSIDVSSQFHHTILFGDLNYRIDHPRGVGLEESEQMDMVHADIVASEWERLYSGDQLAHCLRQGKCLSGFVDYRPRFMPTFKVMREAGTSYCRERIPAHCDRILSRSMPACSSDLECSMFKDCPDVSTSDHKPVHGIFILTLPPRPDRSCADIGAGPCLVFDELEAVNLPIGDIFTSDPYVLFFSHPADLFAGQDAPCTDTIKQTLNPVWKNVHLPRMHLQRDEVRYVSLILSVWDADVFTADDPLGNAILAMSDLIDEEDFILERAESRPKEFSANLQLNGQLREGSIIRGKAHIEWPSAVQLAGPEIPSDQNRC